MLRDWERDRSLTRRTKTVAVVSMTLMIALSAWGFQGRPVLSAGFVAAVAFVFVKSAALEKMRV